MPPGKVVPPGISNVVAPVGLPEASGQVNVRPLVDRTMLHVSALDNCEIVLTKVTTVPLVTFTSPSWLMTLTERLFPLQPDGSWAAPACMPDKAMAVTTTTASTVLMDFLFS